MAAITSLRSHSPLNTLFIPNCEPLVVTAATWTIYCPDSRLQFNRSVDDDISRNPSVLHAVQATEEGRIQPNGSPNGDEYDDCRMTTADDPAAAGRCSDEQKKWSANKKVIR